MVSSCQVWQLRRENARLLPVSLDLLTPPSPEAGFHSFVEAPFYLRLCLLKAMTRKMEATG